MLPLPAVSPAGKATTHPDPETSMILSLVIAVLVAIGAVLGLATTKPDTFRVERATTIQAPPDKVFPLINDFHNWAGWSPWEKMDPGMKRTHSGAQSGKGAV